MTLQFSWVTDDSYHLRNEQKFWMMGPANQTLAETAEKTEML